MSACESSCVKGCLPTLVAKAMVELVMLPDVAPAGATAEELSERTCVG